MNRFAKLSNDRKIAYLALILCSVMFALILPLGQDLNFHLYRIGAMAEQLKISGFKVPIRILSTTFDGYGYAAPLFYGDTFLYPVACLVCLGLDVNIAYRILLISVFILVYVSAYYSLRRISGNEEYAFSFAVSYTFASYFLIDLCIRMALGEAMSFIFLPLVFTSMYGILNRENKYDWIYLSISMSVLIACHNLTAVMTVLVLFLYFICSLLTGKGKAFKYILISLIKAVIFFIGVSASFIFPFIEASMFQKYQMPSSADPDHVAYFAKHILDIFDFFFPYEVKVALTKIGLFEFDLDIWAPGTVGLILILILIFRTRMGKCRIRLLSVVMICASFAYAILFISPVMKMLASYFAFMQFGWRIISFCTFFWCLYLAYYLCEITDKKSRIMAISIVILIGLFSISMRYAYQTYINIQGPEYMESINPEYAENYRMEYSPNKGDHLYLPASTDWNTFKERGAVVLADSKCDYTYSRDDKNALIIDISSPLMQDTIFECPLYIYKGYSAYDAMTSFDIVRSDGNLVSIAVPKGYSGSITVSYTGTMVQRISDYISILSIIFMMVIIYLTYKKTDNQLNQM